ncbi:MAG TPA: hypothetical protein VJV78_31655 [Polyangiales bacterium]|nr:hypothetical protein [Polyangiales bacterium]
MAKPPTLVTIEAFTKVVCPTAAFGSLYGGVIYVGSHKPVTAADWDGYLAFITPLLSTERALPRVVWDDSGGPSALGRQKLASLTEGCPVKVAIITDAAAGRNTATVLNWNRKEESYRTFPSSELEAAIEFTGIAKFASERVQEAMLELRSELGF